MNSETLLLDAWLRAGIETPRSAGCAGEPALLDLLAGRMQIDEARRTTAHLSDCAECRRSLARLAEQFVPSLELARLSDILAQGSAGPWRRWINGLVESLPTDEMSAAAGEGSFANRTARIDDFGRLAIDWPADPQWGDTGAVSIRLTDKGVRLDLCEVRPRDGRLRAIVDLSAIRPRAGNLRAGSLELEAVRTPTAILPLLAELERQAVTGIAFWDRFAPVAAYGPRLRAALQEEIVRQEADPETQAPRRLPGLAAQAGEPAWLRRVQYALEELDAIAALWRESNGSELPGASEAAAQMRAVLTPNELSGSPSVSAPISASARIAQGAEAAPEPKTERR